jgi:hypothetical protein
MPSLTPSRSQNLRDTNCRMRFWLDSMMAQSGQPAVVSPERMAALLSELLQAGVALRAAAIPARGTDPELDAELDQYRKHVARLHLFLPSIHNQLLIERARLEVQRNRVRSASEWARASRQTL